MIETTQMNHPQEYILIHKKKQKKQNDAQNLKFSK